MNPKTEYKNYLLTILPIFLFISEKERRQKRVAYRSTQAIMELTG